LPWRKSIIHYSFPNPKIKRNFRTEKQRNTLLILRSPQKDRGALAHPFSFLDLKLKRVSHIMDVTAELLPRRLASLALGTGDLDCVYHFALPELREAVKKVSGEDQLEMLSGMIDGRRLRDISDLPFDLAI
jgi:hypothetical protein